MTQAHHATLAGLDTERWLTHFEHNRKSRPEPDWAAPIKLPLEVTRLLVHSLEQFQLGDGGGPASLIAWNAEWFRSQSPAMRRLVDLWFEEEKEHSRLLLKAVKRFDGTPIRGHWSFTAFCWVRRLFGVRSEVTILLLTEIVSTIYYRLIRRHGDDPAVKAMCRLILRDEAGHIAFHRARMAGEAGRKGRRHGAAWAWPFMLFGYAAATMLWINHGLALTALGASRGEFYREVGRELSLFMAHLRRDIEASRASRSSAVARAGGSTPLPTSAANVHGAGISPRPPG